jgi:hypothetical protein
MKNGRIAEETIIGFSNAPAQFPRNCVKTDPCLQSNKDHWSCSVGGGLLLYVANKVCFILCGDPRCGTSWITASCRLAKTLG